jgi:hypothetical protein
VRAVCPAYLRPAPGRAKRDTTRFLVEAVGAARAGEAARPGTGAPALLERDGTITFELPDVNGTEGDQGSALWKPELRWPIDRTFLTAIDDASRLCLPASLTW